MKEGGLQTWAIAKYSMSTDEQFRHKRAHKATSVEIIRRKDTKKGASNLQQRSILRMAAFNAVTQHVSLAPARQSLLALPLAIIV